MKTKEPFNPGIGNPNYRIIPSGKIILDLCGGTGAWSEPYKKAGYDVRLITLPENNVVYFSPPKNVYGILAAPPCTEFSYAKTSPKTPLRDFRKGIETMQACMRIIWQSQRVETNGQKKTSLKFWALENPYGMMQFFLGKPAFMFSPYEYGDPYKKRTHLWGWFNKPDKKPIVCNANKFDMLLSKDIHPEKFGILTRTERRSITPAGFAQAFFEANP